MSIPGAVALATNRFWKGLSAIMVYTGLPRTVLAMPPFPFVGAIIERLTDGESVCIKSTSHVLALPTIVALLALPHVNQSHYALHRQNVDTHKSVIRTTEIEVVNGFNCTCFF